MRIRWKQIAMAGLVSGALAFTGCANSSQNQETVEADEIAAGEGVADRGATVDPDDVGEITEELLFEGDEDLFDSVDRDKNRLIDRDEFEDVHDQVNIFGKFDVNADRKIGEDEFYAVMFEYWDTNENDSVSPGEYLAGALNWFPVNTSDLENFADIDADDDGVLTKGEFVGNMDDIQLFDQWDLEDDARIDRDELVTVLRTIWDVDEDQNISIDEWGGPKPEPNVPVAGIMVFPAPEPVSVDKVGTLVTGDAMVGKVISDRGFWLTSDDGKVRLFSIVREDVPKREMIDIDSGDRLRMVGLLMKPEDVGLVAGELEKETKDTIAKESVFLSVYHGNVEFLSRAE